MVGVDSHEEDSHVMTCMYADCNYAAPTSATREEAVEWIKMHDRARHQPQQAFIQQQQQALEEGNKLVGKPVNSVVTEREEQQLQAVSNTLGEDSEVSDVTDKEQYLWEVKEITGWETEKLVGKPVIATNSRHGEICNAEHSEESRVVCWQQGEREEIFRVTEREEQQQQAGFTSLM
jgi:hypothetical protein